MLIVGGAHFLALVLRLRLPIVECFKGDFGSFFLDEILRSLGFGLTDLTEYFGIAIMLYIVSRGVLDVESGDQLLVLYIDREVSLQPRYYGRRIGQELSFGLLLYCQFWKLDQDLLLLVYAVVELLEWMTDQR
jgi:hypothetical protein